MPPRPHPIVLTALAAACAFVALLLLPVGLAHASAPGLARSHASPPAAAPARVAWRWPLRGPLVGAFRVTPRAPYARGQRRGIDVAAAPGSAVGAACPGRVTFAGALPRLGLAVSVRCGALVATYLHLARLTVGRGAVVLPGQRLGTVGSAGVLRLGARRAADRSGYLDPLTLLRDGGPAPPDLGPAPRPRPRRPRTPRPPRPTRPPEPAPLPRAAAPRATPAAAPADPKPNRLPWPAYPALALIATALPVGGLVRRRRRGRRTRALPASHAERT